MIIRRIFPDAGEALSIDADDIRDRLSEMYALPDEEWVRINLVVSVNGSAAGSDDTSETLTNRADRKLLGVIRRQSDVILVGASSVRAEGYQLPRTAPLAIVTRSGDLGGHRIEASAGRSMPIILCPASAADRATDELPGAEVLVVADHDGRLSSADLVSALRGRGYRRITCEGGPSLAGQLLDARLVTELCLSTSPVAGGLMLPMFGSERIAASALQLVQVLVDDQSTLYTRWGVRSDNQVQPHNPM